MKSISDSFRTSVEFDIYQNADKLDFLNEYKIVSIFLNTSNLKLFILKKDNKEYILEVTNNNIDPIQKHNQWTTENYVYTLKKL